MRVIRINAPAEYITNFSPRALVIICIVAMGFFLTISKSATDRYEMQFLRIITFKNLQVRLISDD